MSLLLPVLCCSWIPSSHSNPPNNVWVISVVSPSALVVSSILMYHRILCYILKPLYRLCYLKVPPWLNESTRNSLVIMKFIIVFMSISFTFKSALPITMRQLWPLTWRNPQIHIDTWCSNRLHVWASRTVINDTAHQVIPLRWHALTRTADQLDALCIQYIYIYKGSRNSYHYSISA